MIDAYEIAMNKELTLKMTRREMEAIVMAVVSAYNSYKLGQPGAERWGKIIEKMDSQSKISKCFPTTYNE